MTTPPMDTRAATFQQHRPRLYGIAYRMLGSKADSEDVLQEAYLRWHQSETERVRTAEAWLTTTVTRLCIDRLRAVRAAREAYVGPWLPEPLIEQESPPADRRLELASDLSVAFLVVLERLAPEERAAFLLREVFDCGYPEIAVALGRNETSCRQMVHRARERVRRDRPRFQVSEAARTRLLEKFAAALHARDQQALLDLFAADTTWTSDGGGKVKAAHKVVRGAESVARFVAGVWRRHLDRLSERIVSINGEPGLLLCVDGRPMSVVSIKTDGQRILAAYAVLNPDKLKGLVPERHPDD
ncbi:MAG: RNA polymerase sigma-70 factor [Arenicellales bacterium]